jgi:glycosyltransferase involved in cell wall biosynthesis
MAFAMTLYGRRSARQMEAGASRANVFHFRSGFGGDALHRAKQLGLVALCDHSIVHPSALEEAGLLGNVRPIWDLVREDLSAADHVVANSDYAASTFPIEFPRERLSVVYLGLDDSFAQLLESAGAQSRPVSDSRQTKFLFAGGLDKRKGVDLLAAVVGQLEPAAFSLDVAGPDISSDPADIAALRAHPSVKLLGPITRQRLAEVMVQSDVLVLPTRAEGSARVVFEAMGAGCFIITTHQAGSVLETVGNGYVITEPSVAELHDAMERTMTNLTAVRQLGLANREVVLSSFRQNSYGDNLARLYEFLSK